jgi:hypothetical protein
MRNLSQRKVFELTSNISIAISVFVPELQCLKSRNYFWQCLYLPKAYLYPKSHDSLKSMTPHRGGNPKFCACMWLMWVAWRVSYTASLECKEVSLYENHFITWREDFDEMNSANWKTSDTTVCNTQRYKSSWKETWCECKNELRECNGNVGNSSTYNNAVIAAKYKL